MSARVLIDRLRAEGISVQLNGDNVRLTAPPQRTIDRSLIAEIRATKAEVVEELRRCVGARAPTTRESLRPLPPLTASGKFCLVCKRVGRAFPIVGGHVCPTCAEMRVNGCARFTVLRMADEATETRYGACLSCGASHELHGRPEPGQWRRVDDAEDVELVAVRYVLASAARIANAHT